MDAFPDASGFRYQSLSGVLATLQNMDDERADEELDFEKIVASVGKLAVTETVTRGG